MKILELFSGIGSYSAALKRLGIKIEIVDAVEIDKYAIASFNAIHGTNFKTQDIKNYNKAFKNIDLITHGSPCQDFSIAGKQEGGDLGSKTRSSLMYESIRIIGQNRPKYVVWENVKNILSSKHKHNFENYINTLNCLGYNSYYKILNAKDYGIPQNRERVYTISIRQDIDNKQFKFPEKEELKIRLKDVLEQEVDKKYYLSQKMIAGFIWNTRDTNGIASTLRANAALCPTDNIINIGEVTPNSQAGQVYSSEGIFPTIIAGTHGYANGNIIQIGKLDIKGQDNVRRVYSKEGVSPTLTNMQGGNRQPKILSNSQIRRLTPKECWRLMGFSDEDFKKAQNIPTSDTQLYKQAGNSIVVNVLKKIFLKLFNSYIK